MKKKPIAVTLTDTHLTKENIQTVESIFEQAFELAEELGCKYVFHGGDWFTDRIGQNLQTLLALKRILNKAKKRQLEIIGIHGNHDKTNQDSEESYLDIYSQYKYFTLIRVGDVIDFEDEDLTISFLPFFTNSYGDRLTELVSKAKELGRTNNILITHIGVNGVKNNDGTEVTEGISPSKFKFFTKVLIGHYHDASDINDIIRYMGSSYQANFGENIIDKGFTVIYSDGTIKFFKSKFKKFIKVVLEASDIDSQKNELEVHKNSGDNVRFIFKGKQTDIDNVNQSVFSDEGIDCKFEVEELNNEILEIENYEFTQLDDKKIVKHFFDYCKIQKIDSEKRKKGLKFLTK